MPGGSSSGACARCRARHVKCDEGQPGCSRCASIRQDCPGYVKERKFLDEGVNLRRKYNSSSTRATPRKLNLGKPRANPIAQAGRPASEDQPILLSLDASHQVYNDDNQEALDITETFNHRNQYNTEQMEDEMTVGESPLGTLPTPEAHLPSGYPHHSVTQDLMSTTTEASSPTVFTHQFPAANSPEGSTQYAASISGSLAAPTFTSPASLPRSSQYGTEDSLLYTVKSVFHNSCQWASSQVSPLDGRTQGDDSNHEILFLLRHFSEVLGPWMDLYDLGNYFASYVASNAPDHPLLRYAAVAIAAKQLGQVNGVKAIVGGVCSSQADMEIYPDADEVDWFYLAAKYYDKAIACLREALISERVDEVSDSPTSAQHDTDNVRGSLAGSKRRRITNSRIPRERTNRLLTATSILSVYEFLDDSHEEWSRHLNGVKCLLDEAEVVVMPRQTSPRGIPLQDRIAPSRAQMSCFWNFARCDYLAAYIKRTTTRLDTRDIPLWRTAGLLINDEGFIIPTKVHKSWLSSEDEMREDMVCNAMVWIASKIVNYLARIWESSSDSPTPSDQDHASHWHRLIKELDIWHDGLCESFRPSCRLEPQPALRSSKPARALFPELFYAMPMCAAIMQHYHFSRILLLLHKPRDMSSLPLSASERLRSYREISQLVDYHCREICGVALGRPPASVRIHMLQPLFVAGQCLDMPEERQVVLDLLRGIEKDLGWATEYRVKELLLEWGWEQDGMNKM